MKIVIDITETIFKKIEQHEVYPYDVDVICHAILSGTPLPKGHGRLIDADALWGKWVFDAIGKQEIDEAPTIIEGNDPE